MDTGNKTLAQLAQEHNETKYITLETASKISGYKKEYIEKLCFAGKIEYRLWNNDQPVPELDSLLKETQTILVSYDGIDLVNKEETRISSGRKEVPMESSEDEVDPLLSVIRAPEFSIDGRKERFVYVGRPVVSNPNEEGVADDDRVVTITQQAQAAKITEAYQPKDEQDAGPELQAVKHQRFSIPVTLDEDVNQVVIREQEPEEERIPSSIVPEEYTNQKRSIQVHEVIEMNDDSKLIVEEYNKAQVSGTSEDTYALGLYQSKLPTEPNQTHMIAVERSPLSNSSAFQAVFALTLVGLAALIGYFNLQDPATTPFAMEGAVDDLMANVAGSFSDDVIITKTGSGNGVVVEPIFRETTGAPREFIVIPLGK